MKNCGELLFLSFALNCSLGEALEFSLDHSDCTELGVRAFATEKTKMRKCAGQLQSFYNDIEKGVLQKLGDIGIPCSGLGDNVLGMIGMSSLRFGFEKAIRFMYSSGSKLVCSETLSGKQKTISRQPGCFPEKTMGIEPRIYVFPTPRDVIIARNLWNLAGLGQLPAYVLSGAPLPGAFNGTKHITFVNVNGKIARPEVLSAALATYKTGIDISDRINLDLNGLRSIFISDAGSNLRKPVISVQTRIVGQTKAGEEIYFSKKGYFVSRVFHSSPSLETNFAFLPKKMYISNYPLPKRITFADLYVDGELQAEMVNLPESCNNVFWKMERLALAAAPEKILRIYDRAPFSGSTFLFAAEKQMSFPFVPCVHNGEIVFPKFRICENGFANHAELLGIMEKYRENYDYMALEPGQAGLADLTEFIKLASSNDECSKVVVLGICAWMYMAVTGLVESSNKTVFPKLCFEIHTDSKKISPASEFLSALFSGVRTPYNSSEKNDYVRVQDSYGAAPKVLPKFFAVDARQNQKTAPLYRLTKAPGMYFVKNSDLKYPINAHGNLQCAVVDKSQTPCTANLDAIRRCILHILWKYVQNGKKINKNNWVIEKPELFMYNSISSALKELNMQMPSSDKFFDTYLNKGT